MFCSKCGTRSVEGAQFCASCGSRLITPALDAHIQMVGATQTYFPATINQRFVNFIIDRLAAFMFAILGGVALAFAGEESVLGSAIMYASVFLAIAHQLVSEALWQTSIGKLFTKTKVVTITGEKPSFLRIVGRTLARLIPFEQFSYLFSQYPFGWHDRLSKTMVVAQELTPQQVRQINIEVARKIRPNSIGLILGIIALIFVAIAVIGVFSSIVLASLSTARDKGQDAQVKANLSNLRTTAALYNDSVGSYNGFCDDERTVQILNNMTLTESNVAPPLCIDWYDWWIGIAQLKSGPFWCTDSLGDFREVDVQKILANEEPPHSCSDAAI